jgi:hypothetical protein
VEFPSSNQILLRIRHSSFDCTSISMSCKDSHPQKKQNEFICVCNSSTCLKMANTNAKYILLSKMISQDAPSICTNLFILNGSATNNVNQSVQKLHNQHSSINSHSFRPSGLHNLHHDNNKHGLKLPPRHLTSRITNLSARYSTLLNPSWPCSIFLNCVHSCAH